MKKSWTGEDLIPYMFCTVHMLCAEVFAIGIWAWHRPSRSGGTRAHYVQPKAPSEKGHRSSWDPLHLHLLQLHRRLALPRQHPSCWCPPTVGLLPYLRWWLRRRYSYLLHFFHVLYQVYFFRRPRSKPILLYPVSLQCVFCPQKITFGICLSKSGMPKLVALPKVSLVYVKIMLTMSLAMKGGLDYLSSLFKFLCIY